MFSTKLLSDAELPLAINTTIFPALIMAFTSEGVTQGDGVTTAGSVRDLISGRIFTPQSVDDAMIDTVPAGTFGCKNGAGLALLGSGAAMPNWGTKNLLMISVRHGDAAGIADIIGASSAGGSWNNIATRSSAAIILAKGSTNYMTGGAVTSFAEGVWAQATILDRNLSPGIAAATHRIAGASSNLTIAASAKTGTSWNVTADALNSVGPGIAFGGVADADNNYHYGVYLFAFDNPTGILGASLNSILQWMQRNPTKGPHPFLQGLT